MGNVSLTTFTDSLAQLRQALADADPLAASPQAVLFSATAEKVASAFASAPEASRQRFLLRALDDAIAAIEVAARLADELHGLAEPGPALEGEPDALQRAYRAFTESQTTYQALYQYRNVLAAALRLESRQVPDAVSGMPSEDVEIEAPGAGHVPVEQPHRRSRKRTGQSERDKR